MEEKKVLAVDLGASSGRVMLAAYDGTRIRVEELHRFSNDPVLLGGTMYWDFLRLFYEIKQGILKAKDFGPVESISVDTWGVDFGLLDKDGYLLENPVHYRDGRVGGMLEKSFELLDRERFYAITGNQFMEINTAFQMLYLSLHRRELLDRADSLLMMPDLFHYYLCGKKSWEYSAASTTQLLDARSRQWSKEVLDGLGVPSRLFGPVTDGGRKLGSLLPEICEELGVEPMQVVSGAGHDTQCALAAVPTQEKDFIFISCGTWCLFGTELEEPVVGEKSAALNIANEMMTTEDLEAAIRHFEREEGINLDGRYCVCDDYSTWTPCYKLYLEADGLDPARAAELFDSCLSRECWGYHGCRKLGEIGPPRVVLIPEGSFAAYDRMLADSGRYTAQGKPLRILNSPKARHWFE